VLAEIRLRRLEMVPLVAVAKPRARADRNEPPGFMTVGLDSAGSWDSAP